MRKDFEDLVDSGRKEAAVRLAGIRDEWVSANKRVGINITEAREIPVVVRGVGGVTRKYSI